MTANATAVVLVHIPVAEEHPPAAGTDARTVVLQLDRLAGATVATPDSPDKLKLLTERPLIGPFPERSGWVLCAVGPTAGSIEQSAGCGQPLEAGRQGQAGA